MYKSCVCVHVLVDLENEKVMMLNGKLEFLKDEKKKEANENEKDNGLLTEELIDKNRMSENEPLNDVDMLCSNIEKRSVNHKG